MGTAEHHDWRIAEVEHRVSLSRRDIQHARYHRPDPLPQRGLHARPRGGRAGERLISNTPDVDKSCVREENNNVFNPISVEDSDAFRGPWRLRFSVEGCSSLSSMPHAGPLRPARPPQHPTG